MSGNQRAEDARSQRLGELHARVRRRDTPPPPGEEHEWIEFVRADAKPGESRLSWSSRQEIEVFWAARFPES